MVDRNSPEYIAALAAADRQAAHIAASLNVFVDLARKYLREDSPIEVMATLSAAIRNAMDVPITKGAGHTADSLAWAAIRLAQERDLKVENETLTDLIKAAHERNKQLAADLEAAETSWFRRIFRAK